MIKWKQCMFGAVLAGAVCMNMPQAAFAYDVPEMIEVGLESVCKNATSASIGSSQLAVGTLKNDKFREDGKRRSNPDYGFYVTERSGRSGIQPASYRF